MVLGNAVVVREDGDKVLVKHEATNSMMWVDKKEYDAAVEEAGSKPKLSEQEIEARLKAAAAEEEAAKAKADADAKAKAEADKKKDGGK